MNIKRAKEEMKHTIQAYLLKKKEGGYEIFSIRQRPILLIGPPGIGKTAIVKQVAQECEIGFVSYTMTHHTRQSAMGLPFIKEKEFLGKPYSVTEYTMSEIIASIYEQMETDGCREGILFLDEINCVSETLMPTMLELLQGKRFGNTKVPEGWIIVAAGNPPEYNRAGKEFDIVTLDRVKYIVVEPDFTAFKEYAKERQVHSAILSYLELNQEAFYKIETTIDGKHFVTARGWEDLSDFMKAYEKLGISLDREVIYEYVRDEKIAGDFANFLELYQKYQKRYPVKEILNGKIEVDLIQQIKHASFDEKISVTSMLVAGLQRICLEYEETQKQIEGLFYHLKECQRAIEEKGVAPSNDLLQRSEKEKNRPLQNTLRLYSKIAEEGFSKVRESFMEQEKERKEMEKRVDISFSHAFDFCEKAFGEREEMVYFLTELEGRSTCLHYLIEHNCEAFYKYQKSLLLEEEREELLKEL